MKRSLLKNFLNFLPQMFNSSSIVALAGNVPCFTLNGNLKNRQLGYVRQPILRKAFCWL
jgi:hypothetical protein